MDTSAVEALGMMFPSLQCFHSSKYARYGLWQQRFEAYRKRKIAFLIAHASGQPDPYVALAPCGCRTGFAEGWEVERGVQTDGSIRLRPRQILLHVLGRAHGHMHHALCVCGCESVRQSVSQLVYPSVCQSVSLSASLSACLPVCLSVCQSVCLSVCLSVSLCVCVHVHIYVCNMFSWSAYRRKSPQSPSIC